MPFMGGITVALMTKPFASILRLTLIKKSLYLSVAWKNRLFPFKIRFGTVLSAGNFFFLGKNTFRGILFSSLSSRSLFNRN